MYPPARRSDHVDTYFNTPVPDPYRWMEDVDAPELEAWVTAQNTLTRSILDPVPGRDILHARLLALTNFERVSAPIVRNGRFVFAHNTGLQNQAVLFWRAGAGGEPHLLLDPNTLSADGTVALAGLALSDDGNHLAYALAEAGSDWITWHVRHIDSAQDLPDRVTRSKFSSASWLPDTSGFLYSGYGLPDTPAAVPSAGSDDLKATQHFHKVFLHTLGTSQSADPVLYERPDDGELLLGGHITDDGCYLLLSASKGHTNQLHAVALDASFNPIGPLIPVAPHADARYDPVDTHGDTLWVHTTSEAPNGRVVSVDLTQPDRANWQTILPETANNLDAVSLVANTLIATYLVDAQSLVQLHTLTGASLGPLTLPAIGTVSAFSGRRFDTESFVTFTNFTTPPTVLRLDLARSPNLSQPTAEAVLSTEAQRSGEIPFVESRSTPANPDPGLQTPHPALTTYRAPSLTFDPAHFETTQVFFPSKDGTRVPMFLTHRRGLALDGQNPTLLYAYGGFNISLLPAFSPSYLLWMELGGIFAQPNLRGGGEYGEAWHEAGTRLKKQNVFDDFIAAAEFLIARGYTSPGKLAIEGGSNGGLLVAAVELQRPELFAAAIAHVGVFDMLRFDQFTIGYAWKPDYGDPSGSEPEFRALLRYSPLHNTRSGVRYPPTLILTADHDDRVFPAHSFKFTAAMQHALSQAAPTEAVLPPGADTHIVVLPTLTAAEGVDPASRAGTPGPAGNTRPATLPTHAPADQLLNPTLIRVEVRAGHGAGMPLSKRIDQTVDVYLFLARFLHLSLPE